ncbi:3'(2'),5'-bisphosphate nucleotidase CysQ family protein [Agaribacterium haliotis]|uniref:3'(2'),5'-bisphosphate nucleotidase CysQ family protein n=1 Tax=Agaribacterium haliotis TaxID=2013869 RepID=UPI000BB52E23|nr:inositol monophosphatase family protein [Agaribacterium haliotis]
MSDHTALFSFEQLSELCTVAVCAAKKAGAYCARVDRSTLTVDYKNPGASLAAQVVSDVDRRCEQIINDSLLKSCRQLDIALLSEEACERHNEQLAHRFNREFFWCIDPLDGSLPFIQGHAGFAVSIALVRRTGEAVLGVVYDPVSDTVFSAIDGGGASKNRRPLSAPLELTLQNKALTNDSALTLYADRSFRDDKHYHHWQRQLTSLAKELGCTGLNEVYGNGAVKNACATLEHSLSFYIKFPKANPGGGSLWDFAASACIAREAGAWVSDIHGQTLDLNRRESTYLNHRGILYASSHALGKQLLKLCRERSPN